MARTNGKFTRWAIACILLLSVYSSSGQDTLPAFSAVIRTGNKVLVSWTNLYGDRIKQLSIQRSSDSQRLFKTIITLPDPTVLKNGYVDTKAMDTNQYYRLYILLDSGRYVFSPSKKPIRYIPPPPPEIKKEEKAITKEKQASNVPGYKPPRPENNETAVPGAKQPPPEKDKPTVRDNKKETTSPTNNTTGKNNSDTALKDPTREPAKNLVKEPEKEPEKTPVKPPAVIVPEKFYTIKRGDSTLGQISEVYLKKFRDSVNLRTKDTLLSVSGDTIIIKPFVAKEVYKVSKYVFPDKTGLLHIELPDPNNKKYKVRFYEEDKSFLFEIKDIREQVLLIDKANFQHAGWFFFEIYQDGSLIEKNRFFIGKDF